MNFDTIHALLSKYRCVAIHGPRGIGKTEVVAKFVWEARENPLYRGIFWMNATNKTTLQASFHRAAVALKIMDEADIRRPRIVQETALEALEGQDDWLLVFDNLEDADILADALPTNQLNNRHILITGRMQFAGSILRTFDHRLGDMDVEEGSELFLNYLHRDIDLEWNSISKLVTLLGCLPIAIVQVATYLTNSGQSITSFVQNFNANKSIWSWQSEIDDDITYARVCTVISIFLQNLVNPHSVRLLCRLSYLDANNIPEFLWTTNPNICDKADEDSLRPLLDFGLVTRSQDTRFLSIPKLTQEIVRDAIDIVGVRESNPSRTNFLRISPKERSSRFWLEQTIDVLERAYHSHTLRWDKGCELLTLHAFQCIELCKKYHMESYVPLAGIYYNLADYLADFCGQDEATELFQAAFKIYNDISHSKSADVALAIARCFENRSQYDEALIWLERAMRLSARPSSGWSSILKIVVTLEIGEVKIECHDISGGMNQYNNAQRLARVYSPYNKQLDFGLAYIDSTLGSFLIAQNRILEAQEPLMEAAEILSGLVEHIKDGAIHPSLKTYTEAFCFRRDIKEYLLEISKYCLYQHYAWVLVQLKKLDEAVETYQKAVVAGENSVKYMDFHSLVSTFLNLGYAEVNRGKYTDAIKALMEGLKHLQKRNKGATSKVSGTMQTGERLETQLYGLIAEAYYCMKQYNEALDWLNCVTASKYGSENSHELANTFAITGKVYYAQSKYSNSLEMFRKAQVIYCDNKTFFIHSGGITTWIVEAYLALEQPSEAIQFCHLALEIIHQEIGDDAFKHYSTALTLEWYAKVLRHEGNTDEAIQMLELAFNVYEECLGKDHFRTKSAKSQLESDRDTITKKNESESPPSTTSPTSPTSPTSLTDIFALYLLLGLLKDDNDTHDQKTSRIQEIEVKPEKTVFLPSRYHLMNRMNKEWKNWLLNL